MFGRHLKHMMTSIVDNGKATTKWAAQTKEGREYGSVGGVDTQKHHWYLLTPTGRTALTAAASTTVRELNVSIHQRIIDHIRRRWDEVRFFTSSFLTTSLHHTQSVCLFVCGRVRARGSVESACVPSPTRTTRTSRPWSKRNAGPVRRGLACIRANVVARTS